MSDWKVAYAKRGKYVGRRTAYVVDCTFGADLVVYFGRRTGITSVEETVSQECFSAWCDKYRAKRVEKYFD